jgi:PAS domain S-box-containing protein
MALSGIGELPLFKRRSAGAEEIEALLDLLPHPTLIADSRSGRILFANAQASQLTAYTRREFLELNIATLLPEFAIDELEKAKSKRSYNLIKRNSSSLSVAVKTSTLGGPDHWVALSVQSSSQAEQETHGLDEQRWEAFHLLSLAAQQSELASCYRQILQAGALLTGARHLLLYAQAGDGFLKLEAVMGSGVDFPTQLGQNELGHLRLPRVWQPGKPIDSALHKVAHAAKLSYLASTPLDLTQPESGILVAADEQSLPAKELLTMLQILAASIATAALGAELQDSLSKDLRQLSESKELNAALQESVEDGLVFTDSALKIVEINPSAETMLGYTTGEIQGRPANDVLIGSQSLLPDLEQAIRNGKPVEIGERKLHRRDGSEFLALVRLAPIQTNGHVGKLTIFLSDLSEHEAFHVRSQQLQQRAWLGEVTAIFAHEVRNPINNISTGLQLMQMNLPEQDPMQEQIKKLQEDCDRLEHRMKSVLSFSRSLDHNPEPLDMAEFCRQQLERWRPRMARKGIQDHLQTAANTPPAYGDRRALDQVFTNLITNAIQAMEGQDNGFLAIKVAPNPHNSEMVDIHISDNGPGIPEDLRKRVFEPFFTTKDEEGTGLGLAITRRIIMAHKGEIDLESFPGGTLFKIQLPVAPAEGLKDIEAQ